MPLERVNSPLTEDFGHRARSANEPLRAEVARGSGQIETARFLTEAAQPKALRTDGSAGSGARIKRCAGNRPTRDAQTSRRASSECVCAMPNFLRVAAFFFARTTF